MIATETNQGLVRIEADGVLLEGNLLIPERATGVVLFAHGSGSSRFSSRNRYVAEQLRAAGVGTLLIDLLTQDEEQMMKCERRMEIVPGASHLFEEPGTLEKVARLASNWFTEYLK